MADLSMTRKRLRGYGHWSARRLGLMYEFVRARVATCKPGRMLAGGRRIDITPIRERFAKIRSAIACCQWLSVDFAIFRSRGQASSLPAVHTYLKMGSSISSKCRTFKRRPENHDADLRPTMEGRGYSSFFRSRAGPKQTAIQDCLSRIEVFDRITFWLSPEEH